MGHCHLSSKVIFQCCSVIHTCLCFILFCRITVSQNLAFLGLSYSSPILVCAMGLMLPTFSFLLSIILRLIYLMFFLNYSLIFYINFRQYYCLTQIKCNFQEDKDRLEKLKLPGQSNWHYNINHGGTSSWTLQGSIYKNIFSFFHLFFLFGLIWESSTIFCLLLISNRTLGSWWHFVGRSLYICLSMEHYSGNSIKFQITFPFKPVLHFIN